MRRPILKTQGRRLAELERRLAARYYLKVDAVSAQFFGEQITDEAIDALSTYLKRIAQPGYELTAEDEAIDRRWQEAVRAAIPEAEQKALEWQQWALAYIKAVKNGEQANRATVERS